MLDRFPQLRRTYLSRLTILFTVLTGLFAEGLYPSELDRSRFTAAAPFAACVAPCFENFDNVTAPALPPGWTSTITSAQTSDPAWITVNNVSDSATNSAFASGPNHVADNRLISRNIGITSSTSVLTFRRRNNFESGFDGMVLEISLDGQTFQDIISAGGLFVNGGYNGTIAPNFASPIAGRSAWTGSTGGFVTTTVNLPSTANQKTVRFRWRAVSDESVSSEGAFIDSINLTNFAEPPANDNFANAQPILGSTGMFFGTNAGATREENEPNHAGIAGVASVWFRWQAPENGNFVFTTFGSDGDTLLAVYTGSSLPGTLIASNDAEVLGCFGIPGYAGVSFNAIGGTIYHIAVDKKASSFGGNVRLRWGRNASITGRTTDASLRPRPAETRQLLVDGSCYRSSEPSAGLLFTNIPTGFNYSVSVSSPFTVNFSPYPGNPSISPLTGSVTDLNFYQSTPANNISGTVTIPSGDTTGITVMCVSTPGALVSRPASDLGAGKYQCGGLPVGADYVVTPAKLGYGFTPSTRTITFFSGSLFDINFLGALAPTRTISGRVATAGGTGISGVSMALSGSQTASKVTDANGNYSFTDLLQGGNYTVTPANSNVTFTPANLSFSAVDTDQTANFTGTFLLQLVLDDAGQAAALDSSLLMRDPFPVVNNSNLLNAGIDRNTRVTIFLANFQLGAGETPSSVVINLIGSNNQSYDIPAEAVRLATDPTFSQVTFRLPDSLAPGTSTLVVKARGLTSNMGSLKIKN